MDSVKLALDSDLEVPRLESLETCLARADRDSVEPGLCGALVDLLSERGNALPLLAAGPVSYVGDFGKHPTRWCCRADPVHLQPHGDHLRLFDDTLLQVKSEEAQPLIATFNANHEDEDLRLVSGAPARWYLTSSTALDVAAESPDKVYGRNVLDFMIEKFGAAPARRLMNDVQMIFHRHEVNMLREDNGLPAVNSVWLWGGGSLPAATALRMPMGWGDQPFMRGLWSWAGDEAMPLPGGAEACRSLLGDRLGVAVMGDFLTSLRYAGASNWTHALEQLDASWCRPLLAALTSGHLSEFRLISDGVSLRLRPRFLRRWWRRSKTLGDPGR